MEVTFGTTVLATPDLCRVFVTHFDRNMDWSDLDRFAVEVVGIFRGKTIFPDNAEAAEETLAGKILDKLKAGRFNPLQDYVCLAGDILVQAVVVAVVSVNYGPFTALRFDKRAGRYWPFRVKVR